MAFSRETAELNVLDTVFGRISKVIEDRVSAPVFFAALSPTKNTAIYFATSKTIQPSESKGQSLKLFLSKEQTLSSVIALKDSQWPDELSSEHDRFAAAADCLRSIAPQYTSEQDSLYMKEVLEVTSGDFSGGLGDRNLIEKSGIFRRSGYFVDDKVPNESIQLIEFIYSRAGNCRITDRDLADIRHNFFALSALGQAKAVVCWFSNAGEELRLAPAFRRTLDELLTQATIESFLLSLDEALSQEHTVGVLHHLSLAFAKLWWSEKISLSNGEKCVYSMRRVNGELTPDGLRREGDQRSRSEGEKPISISTLEAGLSQLTICMHSVLRNVEERLGKPLEIGIDHVRSILGCDQISIVAPLMNPSIDMNEALDGISYTLGLHIFTNIKAHYYRQLATERVAKGDSWHFQKTVVELTGWRVALEELEKSSEIEYSSPLRSRLLSTLYSLEFAEGLGLLARLVAIEERGNLEKIQGWLDAISLNIWRNDFEQTTALYYDWIESYIFRAVKARRNDLKLYKTETEADGTSSTIETTEPVFKNYSISSWPKERRGDAISFLPPFSIENRAEASRTVLSAIIEPVLNAIKYADKSIFFELRINNFGCDSQHVLVSIGNDLKNPLPRAVHELNGLTHTSSFFSASKLASFGRLRLGEQTIETANQKLEPGETVWLDTFITPNPLIAKIQSHIQGVR